MGRTLRMLRWLYTGRLVLATAIFVAALAAWGDASGEQTLIATLALISAMVVTALGLWWTFVQHRDPGPSFLHIQLLYDMLLVTAVVHITHVPPVLSPYAPLYVLAIVAAALLLPVRGGLLMGVLASTMYFGEVLFVAMLGSETSAMPVVPALLQVGLFVLVAIATALLGDRLRRAGTALGEVESELRQLRVDVGEMLATIDTGLITVDGRGRLAHINAAARSFIGLGEQGEVGEPVLDVIERVAPGMGAVLSRSAATGHPQRRVELRVRRPDGERVLGLRTTVVEREGLPWVTVVLQDITEVKQVDTLMRRAERLEAVAELGASLAHEIKNPLASIRSAVEQLAGDQLAFRDREVLRRLVLVESERLSRLLTDFMEFSRVEMGRWEPLDLEAVVRGAIELVQQHPDRGPGITIRFFGTGERLEVVGDQDLLHRAFFNLVLNAVQHSGPTGLVRVELARVTAGELPAAMAFATPVRVRVLDSGPGVSPESATRMFDPFFSTRAGGTGLGLALVHRAVEAHHGTILVEAHEGPGACFTLYLPAESVQEAEIDITA